MEKMVYVEWFNSPAKLSRFICLNKIKPKNIVSILINKNGDHEFWFYSKCGYKYNKESDNGD